MLSRSRALLIVGTFMALAVPLPAQAAETSNSEFVIIPEGDVLEDDLYAGAIKVSVEGTIDGDLIAFAGEEVVINGAVTGSVLALAPTVTVNGTVGGSVRMSGATLIVDGEVKRDIVASAYSVDLGPDSLVGGEVIVWAVRVSALGTIENDLSAAQRSLELAGSIGGDVDVTVSRLEVTGPLQVAGDLGYRSSVEAEGLENAEVGGTVVRKDPLPPNIRVRALGLLGRFLVIIFLTVVALAVAWGWPERTERAIDTATGETFRSWGTGALILSSPLLIAALAGLVVAFAPASASFPLLAILVPMVIAAFGVAVALAVVAGVPAAGALGSALFSKLDLNGAVLAGSAIVGLVWLLPIIGWVVPVVTAPLGLGAWIRGRSPSEVTQA